MPNPDRTMDRIDHSPNHRNSWTAKAEAFGRLTGWRAGGAAFLLGALAALAMPPVHAVPFLIPAFIGLVLLLDSGPTKRSAFMIGWLFGLGFFAAGLYWITEAFFVDAARFGWMAPFALVIGAGALGLETGIAMVLYRAMGPKSLMRIPVLASLWVGSEMLRGWAFTGFPWNLIGATWTAWEAPMQLAAVIGVFGLSWVTLIAALSPLALLQKRSQPPVRWVAALTLAIPLILVGFGHYRLAQEMPETSLATVRLIQPNIEQAKKWKRELRAGHVAKQLQMSLEGPDPELPRALGERSIIIWAETSVPYGLPLHPELLGALGQIVPKGGKAIVGAPRPVRGAEKPWPVFNSAFVMTEQGSIETVYDKHHLVPFGEYLPFRRYLEPLGLDKLAQGLGDFTAGPGPQSIAMAGIPSVSMLICYEIIFPHAVVPEGDRPGWLLNMTNDAWFGSSAGPYQHYAAAKLRAVEQGLPVVRVANGGISAVLDPFGREKVRLNLGESGVIDSPLPIALAPTVFSNVGSWPIVAVLILTLVLGIFRSQKP